MTSSKVKREQRERVIEYCSLIGCDDDIIKGIGEVFDSAESKTKENDLKMMIREMLTELGISAAITGYWTLTEAIYLVYMDQTYLKGITKKLYPKLAELFGGTPSSIERTIRHALKTSFKRFPQDVLEEYFGKVVENGRIRNKDAIAKLHERLTDALSASESIANLKEAESDEDAVESAIQALLDEIGIPKTISGYKYIAEAVFLVNKEPFRAKSFERYVYTRVAKDYNTDPRNVMRGMRYAVLTAYKHYSSSTEFWRCLEVVTTKKVVCHLARRI